MSVRTPALTLHRPWSACFTALPEPIAKRHENRTWETSRRGPVFLHAGQRWDRDALRTARRIVSGLGASIQIGNVTICLDVDQMLPDDPNEHSTGIVALADLMDVCSASYSSDALVCGCGPWAFAGQRHWLFTNVRVLSDPVPCRGGQQLWYPPASVVEQAWAQLDGQTVLAGISPGGAA